MLLPSKLFLPVQSSHIIKEKKKKSAESALNLMLQTRRCCLLAHLFDFVGVGADLFFFFFLGFFIFATQMLHLQI